MSRIESFRDLRMYQCSLKEAKRIFVLTQGSPADEQYSLSDQMRRSSRAVGALLAEAWACRCYRAAFVDKVNQALGEAMERRVGSITCASPGKSTRLLRLSWMRRGNTLALCSTA